MIALNQKESGWCELDGPIDELAENVENILLQKSPILREYYGFVISDDGFIEALPLLLGNQTNFTSDRKKDKKNIRFFRQSYARIELSADLHTTPRKLCIFPFYSSIFLIRTL